MFRTMLVSALVASLIAAMARAEELRLPCTADTSICAHPSEQNHNHGGKTRLRVKGNEHTLLFSFDTSALKGRIVESARLFFCPAGEVRLKTMGVSTVKAAWSEGVSSGLAKEGEVTFLQAAHGSRDWYGPGSTFLSVAFGRGVSEVTYDDVRNEPDGWLSVAVPPETVYAMADGESCGLALSDEKGQTRWNNDVFSREQAGKGSYLVVTSSRRGRRISGGGFFEVWDYPGIDTATLTKFGKPQAAPADAGWVAVGDFQYRILPLWAQMGRAARRKEPYFGGQSGWVFDGKRIELHAARNYFVCLQVARRGGDVSADRFADIDEWRGPDGAALKGWCRAQTVEYIDGKAASPLDLPDPLLPPGAKVGGRVRQTGLTLVELYVAHDAAPGVYRGALVLERQDGEPTRVPVELSVHKTVLPDTLGFKVSLNTYDSPGGKHGHKYPSPEFLAEERAWHRMAHEHRATIAVVPYSQSGQTAPGEAPRVSINGERETTVDWTDWDRRWEPYLTGVAFKGLPRDGVPIDHLYLPLHENWPLDIERHYAWAGPWETHWQRAGPIEQGFDERYKQAFRSVARATAQHVHDKGWRGTQLQCYLNNKYTFKQQGRGSSYWLLDEPMHRDDFLALEFFGRLFHDGIEGTPGAERMVFRVDLSRPQYDRDYLRKVTDLCVCNAWGSEGGYVVDRYKNVWSYGTVPGPDAPLVDVWRWLVAAYAAGCDGMVPWQAVGRQDSWLVPEATSVIYPSTPAMAPTGPAASLRLKALRQAQQDIELMRLAFDENDPKRGLVCGGSRKVALSLITDRKMTRLGGRDPVSPRIRKLGGILEALPESEDYPLVVGLDLAGLTADEIIDLRRRLLEGLDKD